MNNKKPQPAQEGATIPELTAEQWLKEAMRKGVYELVDQELFDAVLVEAKPAWVLPHSLLIGRIRNKDSSASTRWFICGDCETTHTPEEMAANARQAARHFAMSWQAKLGEKVDTLNDADQTLLQQAESLYELTQVDEIWSNNPIV